MSELPCHAVALLFPDMGEREYGALVEDVRRYGQREAVTLWRGQVVDGRHRVKACRELGLQVRTREWEGPEEELTAYVVSLNLRRRHLTESQRGMVAAKLATREVGSNQHAQICAPSQAEAAALLNVSRRTLQSAAEVLDSGDEGLIRAVERGERTVHDVGRELRRTQKFAELLSDPGNMEVGPELYSVLYADPPWRYQAGTTTDSRVIENQYPTLSIEDICALPIAERCTEDAVLFLWAPAPLLPQALRVVSAWGFEYKTSAVWVKPHIGMGYYFRVRHEFLLVATRGTGMTPAPANRRDSVFTTGERLPHSEKPEDVRQAIEAMYPGLAKLELFARTSAPGWAVWGLEAPV